jgi:5-formyltetrahydrofolate cyclo-ligase
MATDKNELRSRLKKARMALAAGERQAKSAIIADRLGQLTDWSHITSLHCFEPIARLNEVNVSDFILALCSEQPNLKIYTSHQIDNIWRVVEWHDGLPFAGSAFDVIIVPMLGFDEELHRIGYGGGYYDRFLATQPTAKKIGVCFEAGKLEQIPVEPHDIPLDIIITEKHTYRR